MSTDVAPIIGDYQTVAQTILRQAAERVEIGDWLIDHICYRVTTLERYREMWPALRSFSSACATTQYNGREFSVFRLRQPLELEGGRRIPLIELPTPKTKPDYAEGLEHIEMVVPDLAAFVAAHSELWPDGARRDGLNPVVHLRLGDGLTVKFHQWPLDKAIEMEGNRFEELG